MQTVGQGSSRVIGKHCPDTWIQTFRILANNFENQLYGFNEQQAGTALKRDVQRPLTEQNKRDTRRAWVFKNSPKWYANLHQELELVQSNTQCKHLIPPEILPGFLWRRVWEIERNNDEEGLYRTRLCMRDKGIIK